MRKKILAIPGSTRRNSVNHLILSLIASEFGDALDVEIFTGLADLPYFNPDVTDEQADAGVNHFRDEVVRAAGVIICTPEYVFSLPGALKNALEWTVSTTAFLNKPTAIIVASGLGEKTFESLTLIMTTLGARIGPQSALLIQGARSKFKSLHEFDERSLEEIRTLMRSLIQTIDEPN